MGRTLCNCDFCRISTKSRKTQIKFFSKRISRLKKEIKRLRDCGVKNPILMSDNPLEHKLACLLDDIMHLTVFRKEIKNKN